MTNIGEKTTAIDAYLICYNTHTHTHTHRQRERDTQRDREDKQQEEENPEKNQAIKHACVKLLSFH